MVAYMCRPWQSCFFFLSSGRLASVCVCQSLFFVLVLFKVKIFLNLIQLGISIIKNIAFRTQEPSTKTARQFIWHSNCHFFQSNKMDWKNDTFCDAERTKKQSWPWISNQGTKRVETNTMRHSIFKPQMTLSVCGLGKYSTY